MLCDAVDYGEYKVGKRSESIIFSMQTFIVKFATAFSGLIVGIAAMFAYNYLVVRVDKVVGQMEARTMDFMDLLNEPVQK